MRWAILIAIGILVILVNSCSTYSVPYQIPYNAYTPRQEDEFAVGVTGSTVTMVSKFREKYRTAGIANGAWFFYNKNTTALSIRLIMYTHTSTSIANKQFISSGSSLIFEYYHRSEVSPEKPLGLIYGGYVGGFYEFGDYVRRFLMSGKTSVSGGMVGGLWAGCRFYVNQHSEYYIKLHAGGPGGISFSYRYKAFDFHFATHILGTISSTYPVSSLGITYRF